MEDKEDYYHGRYDELKQKSEDLIGELRSWKWAFAITLFVMYIALLVAICL